MENDCVGQRHSSSSTILKANAGYGDLLYFQTEFGKLHLLDNDEYITNTFKKGSYWDIDILLDIKQYIPPDRNIIEIGAHCGTSTLAYVSYLKPHNLIYAYEPQKVLFDILENNIRINGLQKRVLTYNKAVFCYDGVGSMSDFNIETQKNRNFSYSTPENYGGHQIGPGEEVVEFVTIDSMRHDDIGFIHCDAQGAESYIFATGINTIVRDRPVILYEDNFKRDSKFTNQLQNWYPQFEEQSKFDIRSFCKEKLHYRSCIECYMGGIDSLLIP